MNWHIWLKGLKRPWNSTKGSTRTKHLEKKKDQGNNHLMRKKKVLPKVRKLNALIVEV